MNVTELVERLHVIYEDTDIVECADAADALEAKEREIADLQAGWQRTYDHDVARLQERLAAENAALRKDAERWRFFVRTASLGFDGAASWNALIRFPVFDSTDGTITRLVDTAMGEKS